MTSDTRRTVAAAGTIALALALAMLTPAGLPMGLLLPAYVVIVTAWWGVPAASRWWQERDDLRTMQRELGRILEQAAR